VDTPQLAGGRKAEIRRRRIELLVSLSDKPSCPSSNGCIYYMYLMVLEGRVMAYNFLAYDEQQLYLLPASIVEWVRDDSLARFVGETVDLLDQRGQLKVFYEGYRRDGWGRRTIRGCW